jgi:hypothetical protein
MTVADFIPTRDDIADFWGDAAVQPGAPIQTYPASETAPVQDTDVITCDL